MNFVENFNFYGVEAKEIPCITGKGAPTTTTEGEVGALYMDTLTGNIYKCIAVDSGITVWFNADAIVMEPTFNLFNKDSEDNVIGYLLAENTPIAISSYSYSHFINVEEGETYYWYNYKGYTSLDYRPCFYDASGTFIKTSVEEQSAVTEGEWSHSTVPIGKNIAKMRVSYSNHSNGADMMVVKGDAAPKEYTPYGNEAKLSKNMEKEVEKTVVKYNGINPNNLFVNPIFDTTDGWTFGASATVVETDIIANAAKFVNSGSSVTIYQDFDITSLKSGHYTFHYKLCEGEKYCSLQIQAIGVGESKEIYTLGGSNEYEFDLDIDKIFEDVPSTIILRIFIRLGNVGTVIISEPYFGICEGAYNGFWNVAFGDAVRRKEYIVLKTAFDAQSEATNPLYGKIISFNGDSICEARATNGGGYATIIGENNNMTVENLGVSGGTIMYAEGKHCISRTVVNMREDADYIILEGGVNDLYSDRPLGTISNGYNEILDDTTFYGAFENMLKQALIRFHGKKIGYIAVHKMTQYFDSDKTEDNAYHAAMKCCKKWGIPVCDLNISCPPFGYLKNNEDTVFMANLYTEHTSQEGVGDGWHPNEEGYRKYYVPKIEAWLKTL